MLLGFDARVHPPANTATPMQARWLLLGSSRDRAPRPRASPLPPRRTARKAIEQGYVDYFSHAVVDKGIVSVAPDGEDYVVAWDLQKAIDLRGTAQGRADGSNAFPTR